MSVPVCETNDDSPVMGPSEATSLTGFYTRELMFVVTDVQQRPTVAAILKHLGEVLARAWHWGEPKPHHAK